MDDPTKEKKRMVNTVMVKKVDNTLPRTSTENSPAIQAQQSPDTKRPLKEMVVFRTDQESMPPDDVSNYYCENNYEKNAIKKTTSTETASSRQKLYNSAGHHTSSGQDPVNMCSIIDPTKHHFVPCTDRVSADTGNQWPVTGMSPAINNAVAQFPARNSMLPPEYTRQIGTFTVSEDGNLYYSGQHVMNAAVRVTGANVVKEKAQYTCEVFIKGRTYQYSLPASEFFSGKWLIDVPQLVLQVKPSDMREYLNGLVECLDASKVIKHIEKPGWQNIDGRLCYVTPEGVLGANNQRIVAENGQRFGEMNQILLGKLDSFLKMVELTPRSSVAAIIVLYTVLGFLREIFKQAGMAPKFILFVLGPSGSQKTSLALAMTQLERIDSPEFTMDATRSGLESGFKRYKDAIMLIDDLAPTNIAETSRTRQSNLEAITRSFGDGTGKKRNNEYLQPGHSISQYEAEGGAIITGEYYEGCASSLARNLILNLSKGDVDLALLTKIQNNPPLAPFMYGFLQWISGNDKQIIDFIRNRTLEYRNKFRGKYSHARYAEYQAQLLTVAELLTDYGYKTEQLSPINATHLRDYFAQQIQQVIDHNSLNTLDTAPITMLCCALVTGIDQSYLPVVAFGTPIEKGTHVILEDEASYYIQQTDILTIKNRYETAHGISSSKMSSQSIAKLLAEERLIEKYQEGDRLRYGKKYSSYGDTRYVKIDKAKLFQKARL